MFGRGFLGVGSGDCGEFGLVVGGDIYSVDGIIVGKGIKYGVYMSAGFSVVWDVVRGVGYGYNRDIGG